MRLNTSQGRINSAENNSSLAPLAMAMTVPGGPTWLGLPFFGLLGFVGAVIGSIWLLLSIWRSGGKE